MDHHGYSESPSRTARAIRERQLKAEVKRLREELQAVIHCVNLYGDETLHEAMDAAGVLPRPETPSPMTSQS